MVVVITGNSGIGGFNTNTELSSKGNLLGLDVAEGWDGVTHGLLPVVISEMGLIQDMVPLSVQQGVVSVGQGIILSEGVENVRGQGVSGISLLLNVVPVAGGVNIDLVDNLATKNRLEDQLVESRLSGSVKLVIDCLGLGSKVGPLLEDGIGFVVVVDAVGSGVDELVLAAGSVHAIGIDHRGNLISQGSTEFTGSPELEPGRGLIDGELRSIVCDIQEVVDRDFEGLEITDVQDPDTGSITLIGELHLRTCQNIHSRE